MLLLVPKCLSSIMSLFGALAIFGFYSVFTVVHMAILPSRLGLCQYGRFRHWLSPDYRRRCLFQWLLLTFLLVLLDGPYDATFAVTILATIWILLR